MKYRFKDGDVITFSGDVAGIGIVRGCASEPVAILGATYIVEVIHCTHDFPNETYPFKFIPVFESQMFLADKEKAEEEFLKGNYGNTK
jgi:hypothetical protein